MSALFARPEPSLKEQIAELEIEIGYRARVFPRWVAEKKGGLTAEKADYRMACMRAALATLVRIQSGQQEGR